MFAAVANARNRQPTFLPTQTPALRGRLSIQILGGISPLSTLQNKLKNSCITEVQHEGKLRP